MLPDKILKKLDRDVELYFGDGYKGLIRPARQLADAGWTWEEIRPLLHKVWEVGWERGHDEASRNA